MYDLKGFPHKGWIYEGENDLEDLIGECEICGHPLRYEHHLSHENYRDIIVGVNCCENLLTPYVFKEVKQKDNIMKQKAKRRLKQMKHYSNYEETKKQARQTGSASLPLGTYVCVVKQVRVIDEDTDKERIEVLYDIAEGEQKGFYKKLYDSTTSEDKKWKGRTLIWSPKDDGSETDQWTKNTHAQWMNAFEDSNKGYFWNWDASSLKDKKFGITLRQAGKVIEGKHIKYNEIAYACSVEDAKKDPMRYGKYKAYKGFDEVTYEAQKNNSGSSVNKSNDFVSIPENIAEEIPF